MNQIDYVNFERIEPATLLPIVNEQSLRSHLVEHLFFDADSIKEWMDHKQQISARQGCRIRAVMINDELAGWCGIQPDDLGFEIAIVISRKFWGCGITIFKTLMLWARELGHQELVFHLLETRPQYRALLKLATKVQKTEMLGRSFTTYFIAVSR